MVVKVAKIGAFRVGKIAKTGVFRVGKITYYIAEVINMNKRFQDSFTSRVQLEYASLLLAGGLAPNKSRKKEVRNDE